MTAWKPGGWRNGGTHIMTQECPRCRSLVRGSGMLACPLCKVVLQHTAEAVREMNKRFSVRAWLGQMKP